MAAVCLVLTVELLMAMIRTGRTVDAAAPLDLPELDDAEPWDGPAGLEWWEHIPAIESSRNGRDRRYHRSRNGGCPRRRGVRHGLPSAELAPVVATARDRFAELLATGAVPSVRALRRELRIGHPRAVRVRAALEDESASESTLATA